ncbi:hypothetical protein VOLCADRAFT_120142 [Volvox carteri f. nagariensis]|uniref:Cyclin N-terminal domain-containing protein n=1 Tax=Volvox carteri f. nagariensis TaxID=3068 RepID=D8TH54_VOLCA|nr:uncharacterized protein VOLCADRAFT_120142 [Volvox carteri f. nagariensis]EFJ52651.1 hypothetical protein VOLCADRAFT_120142 [Volvox carteri f. nagariensis]|eukprot:XP_002945656.1 hypothetical protein VOLCADRAFT_120142 [Volvox carteri f. nagariensis]
MAAMAFPGFPHQPDSYVLDGGYAQGYDGDHGNGSFYVSQQRQVQREDEHKQDLASVKARKAARYVFRSLEDLQATNPSVRDGLDPDKERIWRRQYCKLIQDAGLALKIPQWGGIAGGITLCHRFFAIKSMKKNDRFLIATACLFLAAKIEESPKMLKNVIMEMERIRHSKNPGALRALEDPVNFERLREEVLQAERAVLYTLGFDLTVEQPYKPLMEWFREEQRLMDVPHDSPYKPLVQNSLNLINDSLRTTLCLQFPPAKIAWAALWMADLMNIDNGTHFTKLPRGNAFFEKFEISPHDLTAICDQMLSEYEHSKIGRMIATSGQSLQALKADLESKLGPTGQPAPGRMLLPVPGAPGLPGLGAVASGVKLEEEEGELKE